MTPQLDFTWPFLLHYPPTRVGVIDDACMLHPHQAEGKRGEGSVYAARAPYSAREEEARRVAEYGQYVSAVQTLGFGNRPCEVLGVVPKPPLLRPRRSAAAGVEGGGGGAPGDKGLRRGQGNALLYPAVAASAALVVAATLAAAPRQHVWRSAAAWLGRAGGAVQRSLPMGAVRQQLAAGWARLWRIHVLQVAVGRAGGSTELPVRSRGCDGVLPAKRRLFQMNH